MLKTATIQDYGVPPPDNHKEIEVKIIRQMLKDPDAAKFEFDSVSRDIIPNKIFNATPTLVWISYLRVNGKNDFGGYVGFKPYKIAWKNGRVYAYTSDESFFWEYAPSSSKSAISASDKENAKSSPKQNPQKQKRVKKETRADILKKGVQILMSNGVVMKVDCSVLEIQVYGQTWSIYNIDDKRNTTTLLAAFCGQNEGINAPITIIDSQTGQKLARYGFLGPKVY